MPVIPPQTPVLIGAAQFTDRLDDPAYEQLSPVDITARAAQLALTDVGVDGIERYIDLVMTTRTFEDSAPVLGFPFGKSSNFPRSVCRRLEIQPEHAVWSASGGDSPQKMVTEACDRIASGEVSAALLCGGEALSTGRHLVKSGQTVDWSEDIDEPVDDRGAAIDFLTHDELANGLITPPLFHGLMENARRASEGANIVQWQRAMASLFSPLSQVAAGNPFAAQHQRAFSPEELLSVADGNRMVVAPYTQRLIARDQVNQSAALVLMSTALADDLGIPQEQRVYLHGQAAAGEQPVTLRPDMGRAPSAGLALQTALERAEVNVGDIDLFDFYSCFPIAVSNAIEALGIAADDPPVSVRPRGSSAAMPNAPIAVSNAIEALGIAADDPRGLTLTGGLPYFGGPGNSYSMHAIAEAVARLRSGQGRLALIAANGGFLTKYAVGIYGRAPSPYRLIGNEDLDQKMQSIGTVPFESKPSGQARIESYTVAFNREGSATMSIVTARLEGSNARCLARSGDGDTQTPIQTTSDDPVGRNIAIQAGENFNTFLFAD